MALNLVTGYKGRAVSLQNSGQTLTVVFSGRQLSYRWEIKWRYQSRQQTK